MTLKFFANMLIPEVLLKIKKNDTVLETMSANDVKTSIYAESIIADWIMEIGAKCTVILK